MILIKKPEIYLLNKMLMIEKIIQRKSQQRAKLALIFSATYYLAKIRMKNKITSNIKK